jgi:hypothetical protein
LSQSSPLSTHQSTEGIFFLLLLLTLRVSSEGGSTPSASKGVCAAMVSIPEIVQIY